MSQYYGDIALGDTVQWLFTTVNSSGVPTVLTGTPTATAYTDGGLTQSATGVTLTASFDGVTGLNLISVVASSGNGFASGENIEIVLAAGTVDGNSVVGYAVGSFSIENRAALRPTTAGNTLDVTATGEAGIDWANIGSPTTAQNLSGTNIDVDQVVASVSGAVGSVTGAVGSVTAAVTIDAGSVDAIWDETLTSHVTADSAAVHLKDILADVTGLNGDAMRGTDNALLAASAPANFGDMSITVTTGLVDITQTAADKVWATATRVLTAGTNLNDIAAGDVWAVDATTQQTQGTFGQAIGDPVADTTTIYQAVATDAAGDNVSVDVAAVKAETALIVADTGTDGVVVAAGAITATEAPNLDAAVSTRATPAQVNTEVLDVVNVDTVTLPGQEAPPLAPTMRQMQAWLYKVLRNRKTMTATQWSLYDDAETTVDAKATVSDDATTATKQEIVSGP